MRFWRHPVFWTVLTVAALAFTIGGQPRPSIIADNPIADGDELLVAAGAELSDDSAMSLSGPEVSQEAVTVAAVRPTGDGSSARVAPTDQESATSTTVTPTGASVEDSVGGPSPEEEAELVIGEPERPILLTHVVQKGETLSQIAARYGIDQNTILAANDLVDANLLVPGQKLNILTIPGAVHSVKRGESLWEISRVYRTDMNAIVELNNLEDPGRIRPQQQLIIPGAEAASIGLAMRTETLVSADGKLLRNFSWPVTGRLSSGYGQRWGSMHHGIDIAVPTGTPVRAAAKGRVSFASTGWNGGYGTLVVIDHGNGVETRYAHNSRLAVKVGQTVSRGDIIAYSGNTGRSTGPHVHFEIRLRGNSVNPINYLR